MIKYEYIIHKANLKEALNHGLDLKKCFAKTIHWFESDLRKKAKNDFEKDFFKLKNNTVYGKTMKNVRKHRDIKLVTTERKMSYLVSKPNYYTTNYFTEHLLAIEIKKT